MSGSNVAHSNVNSLGKAIMWTGIGELGATTAILAAAVKTQAIWLSFALTSSVVGFPLLALLASATVVVVGAMVVLCDENKPTVANITNLSPSDETTDPLKLRYFKKNLEKNLEAIGLWAEATQNAVKKTQTIGQSAPEINKNAKNKTLEAQEECEKSLELAGFLLSQIDKNTETEIAKTIGLYAAGWWLLKDFEEQLKNKIVKVPGEDNREVLNNVKGDFEDFLDEAMKYCDCIIKYPKNDFSRFVEGNINSIWEKTRTHSNETKRTKYCLQLQYLVIVLRCLIAYPESSLLEKLYQPPVSSASADQHIPLKPSSTRIPK